MLKGERVLLRPAQPEDAARQHEFNQDVELYGLDSTYPHISPIEAAHSFIDSRIRFGEDIAPFSIEADGKYIGYCSLMHLGDRYGNAELGILIGDREYWGRGYGREAVRLLLHYGFHHLGVRRIHLTTHAKNERAIRCYLACGFVEEGRLRQIIWLEGEYIDLVKMSILQNEWELHR